MSRTLWHTPTTCEAGRRDPAQIPHGTIAWTGVFQALPGNGGPGVSGYPWIITVDTLVVVGNRAYVSGIVTRSAQVPGDLGTRVTFVVTDNGNGGSDLADELDFIPILGGNFRVR